MSKRSRENKKRKQRRKQDAENVMRDKKNRQKGMPKWFCILLIVFVGWSVVATVYHHLTFKSVIPHGGIVKQFDDRHFELLYYANQGELGLFLLEDEDGGTSPIELQKIKAKVSCENDEEINGTYTLFAVKQSIDPPGTASFFQTHSKKMLRNKKNFDVSMELNIKGKIYKLSYHVDGDAHGKLAH